MICGITEIAIMFLEGLAIGFVMAMPVGPIGLLCIRETLNEGLKRGIIVGVGAATADFIFSSVAAFGLTVISETLDDQKFIFRLSGGILMIYIAIKIFRSSPANPVKIIDAQHFLKSYLKIVLLTLSNPFTIFAFLAVFAALNLEKSLELSSASALVAGVFTGSALWFLSLGTCLVIFRKKIRSSGFRFINRVAGVLIVISVLITIVSLF